MDERLIAIIPKNSTEGFHVRLVEFHEQPYVDLRVFVRHWGHNKEPRPTKKGVAIHPDKLGEIIEALKQAEAVAREEGLIKDEAATVPADDAGTPHGESILAAG